MIRSANRLKPCRALRSQLVMRWFGSGVQRSALAITSAERGDGRSYIAANLAVLFSQLGQRTLLIDADMRSARQHGLFGLDNKTGLSTMLAGRTPIAAGVGAEGFPHLRVLCAGPKPPNPLEILLQPALSNLMKQLADDFDVSSSIRRQPRPRRMHKRLPSKSACACWSGVSITPRSMICARHRRKCKLPARKFSAPCTTNSPRTPPRSADNKFWNRLRKWLNGPRQN